MDYYFGIINGNYIKIFKCMYYYYKIIFKIRKNLSTVLFNQKNMEK